MTSPLITKEARYNPDAVPESIATFTRLVEEINWDKAIVSRQVASFGKPYNYSGTVWPEVAFPELISEIASCLAPHLTFSPNNCLANYYPNGQSKMGFHADNVTHLAPGTGIAIVSLGAERPLVFQRSSDRTQSAECVLQSGSLLVMSAEMQADWRHALPVVEGLEQGRISLTFRQISSK